VTNTGTKKTIKKELYFTREPQYNAYCGFSFGGQMAIGYADVIVDLQQGDSGKGKIAHALLEMGDYTHVVRYNGGNNAGHTIYHEGKKIITHSIPCGVLYGIKSIIGPGCVVNVDHFFNELKELQDAGVKTDGLVFIARNAHIITDEHLFEDRQDNVIGTTKRGNGPAYRDKYWRKGIRAEQVPALKDYIVDLYEEFHSDNGRYARILFEGAQGFGLDVDWGDYPYVTSSHCTSGGAVLNGVPPNAIRNIWGVAKIYETYVGAKKFEPEDPIFPKLRELGAEYGATTGRPRQCNWLNIKELVKAAKINGVNTIVFNKIDVLTQLGTYKIIDFDGSIKEFENETLLKSYIISCLPQTVKGISFSGNPYRI
jgi:adenylosuccinate synthase